VFPLGGLLGGILGEAVGLRTTILISGIGTLASVAWVAFSPVSKVVAIPEESKQGKDGT